MADSEKRNTISTNSDTSEETWRQQLKLQDENYGRSFLLEDHNLAMSSLLRLQRRPAMIAKLADEFAVNELLPAVEKIEQRTGRSPSTF